MTALASFLGMTTVVPALRERAREFLLGSDRVVLAKAEGDLSGRGDFYVVVKVKTSETLNLELYHQIPNQRELVFQKRVILPEKRDGYFTYRGKDTNLVLADIDNDGGLEILAPAFDENLVPRLNVYKYDPAAQSVQRLGADDIQL